MLPNVSKIYERCLSNQMKQYFNHILSKYHCGFYKGYDSQHCVINYNNRKMP